MAAALGIFACIADISEHVPAMNKTLLPILEDALTDANRHVVCSALYCLRMLLRKLGKISRDQIINIMPKIAPLTIHPSPFIRKATLALLSKLWSSLTPEEALTFVYSELAPYCLTFPARLFMMPSDISASSEDVHAYLSESLCDPMTEDEFANLVENFLDGRHENRSEASVGSALAPSSADANFSAEMPTSYLNSIASGIMMTKRRRASTHIGWKGLSQNVPIRAIYAPDHRLHSPETKSVPELAPVSHSLPMWEASEVEPLLSMVQHRLLLHARALRVPPMAPDLRPLATRDGESASMYVRANNGTVYRRVKIAGVGDAADPLGFATGVERSMRTSSVGLKSGVGARMHDGHVLLTQYLPDFTAEDALDFGSKCKRQDLFQNLRIANVSANEALK